MIPSKRALEDIRELKLSNHDHDGNKNVTNLHIWQWKTIALHALHVHFSFLDMSQTFSFNPRPLLQLCEQSEHLTPNIQFCFLTLEALVPT